MTALWSVAPQTTTDGVGRASKSTSFASAVTGSVAAAGVDSLMIPISDAMGSIEEDIQPLVLENSARY